MARPIVKYLDPISGEYEFATVVDVGDLKDLNTTIKSDIVGAINSIISDGVHNPINNEKIEDLERVINSLKDGTFKIDDFGSIDEYLKQQFLDELDKINEKNREEIQSVLTQLDTSVDDAIKDYQEKVAAQNIILENAENTLADARDTLETKAAELETANIGLSELETEFNELDNYISTNVRTIDFDNFNAMVEDYESVVTQTSDEVGVDMSGSTLSYLTGRVTDAEANISLQADEISSKMGYDEFQYMPVPKYDYGENLLFDTFDFGDAWSGKNGAQVTPDTFLFGKVVAFNSPTGLYETRTDDLTIGESYVLSTYVNVQPSEKSPSQGRYEPISKSYDPTDFKIQIGGKSFNPGVYEDLSGINGWVRINQEFVADAVNPIISITPTGVNSQNEVAYMAMPKVEQGLTVTPWQPHIEDKYATMSSTQSMMKQQANSITAFVTGIEELDESYKQATSTFQMLADGFKANTEAVEVFEDTVERYGTEYSNINGKFEQKVWKDDFDAIIEDINIDNRNRVLNSDFIRNEISDEDRRLIVEDWSLNSDWEIKTIDGNKYLSRNRTGLTQNLITSSSSNYFLVRDKERVLFGFDLIHSGLDNDKVFAIELFDISDKRLLKEEFSLSSLNKVGNRYHGSFNISTPGVQKGKVVLQLPKNGSVSFTKISFQNADIGSIDWSPAPEDSWIIQSKLEAYISQVEDEITIGGVGRKMDTLTGLLTEDKGTFTLNPDKIATEVFNSETYDDMGFVNKTNFEQTADGWMQEITSEGRLAGYINASPDTYRISFDKILLEGTTWADAIGSSKIMVTENFALMGRNGIPVLNVNNDGEVEMNVSKMNIGASQVATQKDIEDIELTPGPRGKDAVTVSLETQASAYEYTADGELGPVKSRSIQAWHNAVLSGTVYYEFIVNGSTKQNTTNGEYMYKAPESYSDMPQTVEVKIREGSNSSNVLATDFITIVGIKPGLDGGDAYTVMLDNESHAFGGDVSNALANSLDIEVISYKGTDRIIASVGAISGLPSGMTVSVANNNTVSPKISFTVTTSMTSPNGAITIPITVDGKVFNKIFTYSISFKGDKGEQGPQGLQGVSITKVDVEYAQNASEKSAPESGWSTAAPPWENGKYIWSRTKTTYSSGDPTYSKPACITGQKGSEGSNGNHGRGILSIVEQYYLSDSKETRTGGNWTTTAPKWKQGKYMWTRNKINWTNPTGTTETDPIVDIAWEAVAEATKGVGLEDKTEILSGTEIYTDKADDSVVHVEIDGKSYQHAGSGKNLAPHPKNWKYASGASYNETTDEIIIPIGSASVEFWIRWDGSTAPVNLSFDAVAGEGFLWNTSYFAENRSTRVLNTGGVHSANGMTPKWTSNPQRTRHTSPTINSNVKWVLMRFTGNASYTPSEVRIKNVKVSSSSDTRYELPVVTPEYPIEIHSLSDFDVVSSVGRRNYLKNSKARTLTPRSNGDAADNYNFERLDYPTVKGQTYTVSADVEITHGAFSSISVYTNFNSTGSSNIPVSIKNGKITRTYVAHDTKDNNSVLLYAGNASATRGNGVIFRNIKIEKGNKVTPYSPALEDITEDDNHSLIDKINLSLSEPLRSVGNVKDRLFRDTDGLWKIERNVGSFNISPNQVSTTAPAGGNNSYHKNSGVGYIIGLGSNPLLALNTKDIESSHFVYTSSNNYNSVTAEAGTIHQLNGEKNRLFVRVSESTIGAVEGDSVSTLVSKFNNWSNSQNIAIQYRVETPTIETLDQELQYKLNNLRSFQGSNYVYTVFPNKTYTISENLKPTLHATFKGGGWYSRWKTEDELRKHQAEIDDKADNASTEQSINDAVAAMQVLQQEIEAAATANELDDFIDRYNKDMESRAKDERVSEENLSTALSSISMIEKDLGEMSETWKFVDRFIQNTPKGIVVGNESTGSYILIKEDRISFYSNSQEVAFISQNLMEISRGAFVEQIQVAKYQFEESTNNHLTIRYVG